MAKTKKPDVSMLSVTKRAFRAGPMLRSGAGPHGDAKYGKRDRRAGRAACREAMGA